LLPEYLSGFINGSSDNKLPDEHQRCHHNWK
jgi:hypothetical protein